MLALSNGVFYTGENVITDKSMLVRNDQILDFVTESKIPREAKIIDLNRQNVAPGFIDIQINGGGGGLFAAKTCKSQVNDAACILAKHGVTRWMPTFLSPSPKELRELCNQLQGIINEHGVIGLHIEGPWLDEEKKGVHSPKNFRHWDSRDSDFVKYVSSHCLVNITLSPLKICESDLRSLSSISSLSFSIGHTRANYNDAASFFSSGGTGVTHILNAMNQPHSREPGVVAAVSDYGTFASIIADLVHVAPEMIRLLKRAFRKHSLILISDAMPTLGTNIKQFNIGDNYCELVNDKLIDSKGNIAGSNASIADGVRNCVQTVGIPMDEALRMATLYPATYLGINNQFGLLKAGNKADFVIFDNKISISNTYRNGVQIY